MSEKELHDRVAHLGELLVARGWLVGTAESCTGGLVAGALTAVPGSSRWFDRGFITYSNEAKQAELGVPAALLAAHGAVSEPVAAAMAEGVLQVTPGVHLAVSTTGVAGPDGGTVDKPVGMVCFGVAWRTPEGMAARAFTQHLPGDRAAVRAASVRTAVEQLLAVAQPS